MLRPSNLKYGEIRLWGETDDIGFAQHMEYRVKNHQCTLVYDGNLADVDAVDNGVTAPVVKKTAVKITTRYTCSICKCGFEAPKLAGRAKACPECGMATVIDHAAQKQEPVVAHWSDGIKATPEEKAAMKQYMTSKEYIERPAQHLEQPPTPAAPPVETPGGSQSLTQPDDRQTPPTRYTCNQCKANFIRSTVVKGKKTCRECGSDDITDHQVTDVTGTE